MMAKEIYDWLVFFIYLFIYRRRRDEGREPVPIRIAAPLLRSIMMQLIKNPPPPQSLLIHKARAFPRSD